MLVAALAAAALATSAHAVPTYTSSEGFSDGLNAFLEHLPKRRLERVHLRISDPTPPTSDLPGGLLVFGTPRAEYLVDKRAVRHRGATYSVNANFRVKMTGLTQGVPSWTLDQVK